MNAASSIRVFSWFDDPQVPSELWKIIKNGFFAWLLKVIEQLLKLQKLRVVQTFLDVESERHKIVVLFADGLVIDLHIVKNGFFVTQVIVVFHLGISQQVVRGNVLFLFVVLILFFALSS